MWLWGLKVHQGFLGSAAVGYRLRVQLQGSYASIGLSIPGKLLGLNAFMCTLLLSGFAFGRVSRVTLPIEPIKPYSPGSSVSF